MVAYNRGWISPAALMLSCMASVRWAPSAQAKAQGFVCSTLSGLPTTLATMSNGQQVPVIRWTSNVFDGAGWTPERRCQEVSARFDTFNRQGRLTYLTTGRINNQPVICTAPSDGAACDGLLYTIKPGQSATTTLRKLLDVRLKVKDPLYETNGRLYVRVDSLLETPETSSGSTAPSPPSTPTIAPSSSTGPLF